MAFSKVILDDTTLMDVTQKTVDASNLLYGVTALKNDGTGVTGTIASKSSSDVSVSGTDVSIPAGYYPVSVSVTAGTDVSEDTVTAASLLEGITAHQADGTAITGEIPSLGATTYNVSTSSRTISSGQYLSGTQTIRAVTTSNITAANIKDGTTITVGDAGSSTRIKNVTGTFTDASTVSSGQTAATASNIHSGYSAWVDGTEVIGTASTYAQGKTDGWSAAYQKWSYPSSGTTSSFTVQWPGSTYDTLTSRTYTLSVDSSYAYLKYGSTTYARVTNSAASISLQNKSVSPSESSQSITCDSGYDGLGTVTVGAISSTYIGSSVSRKPATIYYTSSSDQTISSGYYLSGTQTIKAVTTSNITAGNIKSGVTITVGDSGSSTRIKNVTGTYEGPTLNGGSWSLVGSSVSTSNTYTYTCGSQSKSENIYMEVIDVDDRKYVRLFGKNSTSSNWITIGQIRAV